MFNPSFFGEDEPIYDGRIFFKGGGLNHQADINTPGELLNQPLLVDGSAQFDKQIPSMFSVYLTTRGWFLTIFFMVNVGKYYHTWI